MSDSIDEKIFEHLPTIRSRCILLTDDVFTVSGTLLLWADTDGSQDNSGPTVVVDGIAWKWDLFICPDAAVGVIWFFKLHQVFGADFRRSVYLDHCEPLPNCDLGRYRLFCVGDDWYLFFRLCSSGD